MLLFKCLFLNTLSSIFFSVEDGECCKAQSLCRSENSAIIYWPKFYLLVFIHCESRAGSSQRKRPEMSWIWQKLYAKKETNMESDRRRKRQNRKKKKDGETGNKIPTVGNGGGSLSLEIQKGNQKRSHWVDYPVGILTTILLYIRALEPAKTTKLHCVQCQCVPSHCLVIPACETKNRKKKNPC